MLSAFQPYNHLVRQKTSALRLIGGFHRIHSHQAIRKQPLFARPPTDAPTIASNKKFLIDTLRFSEDRVNKVGTRTTIGGNILTLENGVLEERVHWLKERLNLMENEICKIIQRQPDILSKRPDTNLAPKLDYLQNSLLLDEKSLRKIVTGNPNVLNLNTEDNIRPTLDYLQEILLLDDESLRKLILGAPMILNMSIEDKLQAKLDYLKTKLLLDDKSLQKIILRAPNILGFSTMDNIEPKLEYLQTRLLLDDKSLQRLILRAPVILCLSTEDNIKPKLDWLQQRLDLGDAALSRMIRGQPQILQYSCNKLELTLNWLQQRLLLTDEDLSKFAERMPTPLLGCSVDANLEPTSNFYIKALGDEGEALALLIKDPALFCFSLERRLKPRLMEAHVAGLSIDAGCLQRIGHYTDEQWYASLSSGAK